MKESCARQSRERLVFQQMSCKGKTKYNQTGPAAPGCCEVLTKERDGKGLSVSICGRLKGQNPNANKMRYFE